MAIVQDVYDIPLDLSTRIATGELRRIGSVIRYAVGPNKGQIVKHLKPIELKQAEEAQSIGKQALKVLKDHKKGALIVAGGMLLAGGGAYAYSRIKLREPKAVTDFRAELNVYILAIREGGMSLEKIEGLMAALEELKNSKDYKKTIIQLSTEDIEILVGRIYEYTLKLAKDNQFELSEEDLQPGIAKMGGTIFKLENYLKAQKKIFETAA